jgi:AcrR family transcriptional regulator
MPPEGPAPADTSLAREPQQARSRRTLERLRESAWELLEAEGPEAVTVTGVAARARVSVGSFYARFEGKEELLHHLEAVALSASLRSWHDAADEAQADAEGLLAHLVDLYRTGPARRLLLLARADGRASGRLEELQQTVASTLADFLPGRSDERILLAAALCAGARELALASVDDAGSWLFGDATSPDVSPGARISGALSTLVAGIGAGASIGQASSEAPARIAAEEPPHDAEAADQTEPADEPEPADAPEPAEAPALAADTSGPAEAPGALAEDAATTEPEAPAPPDEPEEPPPVELFDVWG